MSEIIFKIHLHDVFQNFNMVQTLLESKGQKVATTVADHVPRTGTSIECTPNVTQLTNIIFTPVQEFYAGQSIFITGGTGFIGKLLIDKLVRSCPNLAVIYLLVRPKKGKDMHERFEQLFDDPVFARLKEERPEFRRKIVPILGDCAIPNLGLNETDEETLINEVSIVFHSAAAVSFGGEIGLSVAINIRGLRDMISMCKKMPKLKSFVHVSTAYAHCTHDKIEEKFYNPPIDAHKLIALIDCMDVKLLEKITPHLVGKFPNTYALTKAVAENIVEKEVGNMPIGIFRPAIVISTYQEPIRGWIDNMYGPTGAVAGIATGLLRTVHCNGSVHANIVPGDMTVNALIATAWDIARVFREKLQETPIYNYVSEDNPITYDELIRLSVKHINEYPTIKAFRYHRFRNNRYKFIHLLYVYCFHLLPALLIDTATMCTGGTPKLLDTYRKSHRFIGVISHFATRQWSFGYHRMNSLIERLHPKDKEIFFCDIKKVDWETFFQTYSRGIRIYLLKDPLDTLPEAHVKWRKLFWIHRICNLIMALILLGVSGGLVWFAYT